jgi:DNA repair exonuclease SbcCD ATPase subunit
MPTKLKKIKIEGFRGARLPLELDLTKNSKSIGIYGDNGCGKSTITDSAEWFYTDKIDHLWREDCKQECLRNTQHPNDKDAVVSIELNDDKFNSEKSIKSNFRSKYSNNSEEFKQYIEQSRKERLFLRYQDILRFILLTKGKKRTELMNIIGYKAITDIRDVLVRISNDIQKDQRYIQVNGQIKKNEADLMENFNQVVTEEDELYEIADDLVKPLQIGIKITDAQSFKECREKIKTTADKEKLKRSTKLTDFKTSLNHIKAQIEDTEDYDAFLEAYKSMIKNKEKINKIGLVALLEKGQKAIVDKLTGENTCPLCLSDIESSDVLQKVAERIEELEEINKEVEETNTKKNSALTNIRNIKNAIDDAQKKKLDDDPDFKEIISIIEDLDAGMEQTITDTKQKFQKMEILEKDTEIFETKFAAAKKEIETIIPKIEQKITALAETDAQKKQYETYGKLRDLKRIYEDNKNLSKEQKIYEKQIEALTKIKDEFIKTQATVLQDVLDAISGDVDTFYNMINPEEGIANIRLELIGDEGVEFHYSFHGKEVHPPIKYLSESHLNCVGICLFLASVKLFNKENKFFILDDVITSFDSNHRIPFLRLLKEHFPSVPMKVRHLPLEKLV